MSKKVKNLKIDLQDNTDKTVYLSWTCSASHIDHFHVQWYYTTGDEKLFDGGSEDVTMHKSTYTAPSQAVSAKGKVKPVSETYKKNDEDVTYWTGVYVTSDRHDFRTDPPATPSAPDVSVDQYKMTAMLDNISDVVGSTSRTDQVEFYVLKGESKFTSGVATVKNSRATYTCTLQSGYKYRAKCRAINVKSGTIDEKYWTNSADSLKSSWSDYSSEVTPVPPSVTNVKCSATGEDGEVKVTWSGNSCADSYTVEYAKNKNYFDSSSDVNSSDNIINTTAYITGLDMGEEWFFRVKAVNSQGDSGWSSVVSAVLGTTPNAPTTWSSTTKGMIGDTITLYWTHNTQDGSEQSQAQVELTINGSTTTETITDDTKEYELDLSGYTDGATVLWRVRTAGITEEYSDWSIQRSIDVYAPPTLSINLNLENDTLFAFPLDIDLVAGPDSQTAITYFVSIVALYSYETVDYAGRTIMVESGDEVYSKNFNVSQNSYTVELSAGDLDLAAGQVYRVYVVASMNSGLSAEAYDTFEVNWGDAAYDPDAGIGFDYNTYTAYISPFCEEEEEEDTDEEPDYDEEISDEEVPMKLVEDVVLSVYRREYDGKLTEIATELDNDGMITVTDPHPSLDYARYRIVARGKSTSIVGFTDLPGYPVKADSIVIQWDEDWSSFDFTEEAAMDEPVWAGSMLVLPGNIDITEERDKDVSLVEYIGRENPVSYYGTQQGEGGSWSCDIPKRNNQEMIYNLRRLSAYEGDVYVREPSGIGYWAQITVDMSQTHCETVIPVSFTIKRVEGGSA